jgi:hypothetical protein
MNWSLFSFFRKRIPSETEVAKKEHEKKVAQERAEMKDDDENIQPHTRVVEEEDDFEDYEDIQHKIQSAPKEKKEGNFMSKIFGFGGRKQEEPEEEEEDHATMAQQQQQNIEDLKETIKVLHRWLEKLPPDRISEFKRSPDFERYKDGLRKLGLIKE